MTDYVSVSAYNDAELLRGCLASIREILPDAEIAVVDGRYESWPNDDDNSTDATADVAREVGATYHAGGPFHRECDKHEHRVSLIPNDTMALFMDADERLIDVDTDALPRGQAFQPRIFNALVYGPTVTYWPRIFKPEWVQDVNRWDAYLFDVECERTDAVTIAHRHDLRDREYREAKYDRFENEGRTGRYDDGRLQTYLEDDWDVTETRECPNCQQDAVTKSEVTAFGRDDGRFSHVEACVAGDRCYQTVVEHELDGFEYLPHDWQRGFKEEPQRVKLELLEAGCSMVGPIGVEEFVEMEPAISVWIDRNLNMETVTA